jgi:hypothetical protein
MQVQRGIFQNSRQKFRFHNFLGSVFHYDASLSVFRFQMTRHASNFTPDMLYEKFNELSERLREIGTRLPVAELALKDVRQKLAKLHEKRQLLKVGPRLRYR